jgi:hypothetical protein
MSGPIWRGLGGQFAVERVATLRGIRNPCTDLSDKAGYYLKNANRMRFAVLPADALIGVVLTPQHSRIYHRHVAFETTLRGCLFERQSLYLILTGNESGGWFSNEIVPLSRIEEVLDALPDRHQVLSSKCLRSAFISQSVNNWAFLGAVLRAGQLLMPAPYAPHQHVLADDSDTWKNVMLSEPGVPYVPLSKGAKQSQKPVIAVAKDKP